MEFLLRSSKFYSESNLPKTKSKFKHSKTTIGTELEQNQNITKT